MKVLLDLRPEALKAQQASAGGVGIAFVPILLLFLLFLVGLVNVAWSSYVLFNLLAEREDVSYQLAESQALADRLAIQIGAMERRNRAVKDTVDFLLKDTPSIEVLATVNGASPNDFFLEKVEIADGAFTVAGVGKDQGKVVAFATGLNGQPVFQSVSMPVTEERKVGKETWLALTSKGTLASWKDYLSKVKGGVGVAKP
ncbi:Fimbrial assembly family protein [Thermanaerovibrio acidaminovorans DSM 6589]|uniref:Fimbrial assembly family protein n=1 Tax=Thermanaerovibrio acidaminovorans (strain ATCC 49978 / DSM 6589 / Su883) TaxID=525903 RepID=D1B5I7_THEAS|nr:PilN domain-containing protein [Thermanaerovibrio acidaminovorans]ACZ19278.1 Fimbrial assembly family protein [Thermanaerovibrio acidaminovorans DSM 6589]